MERTVHTLKGTVGVFGAEPARLLAEQIEALTGPVPTVAGSYVSTPDAVPSEGSAAAIDASEPRYRLVVMTNSNA